jgi:hypothetical protein
MALYVLGSADERVVAIQVFTAHRTGRVTTWEPLLTVDKAYRATFHFIHQYYQRVPIDPFLLMLVSMTPCSPEGDPRKTDDPTWNDWLASESPGAVIDLQAPASPTR